MFFLAMKNGLKNCRSYPQIKNQENGKESTELNFSPDPAERF